MAIIHTIMSDFKEQQGLFAEFKERLIVLLHETVRAKGLEVTGISGRVKEEKSLYKKIMMDGDQHYKTLLDVPDVVGLRMITPFESEVGRILHGLSEDFIVEESFSPADHAKRNPEHLGYASSWVIIRLTDDRKKLVEYERFAEFRAEIQVCSVIQYAWENIVRNYRYPEDQFPSEVLREYSQAAYLLELADSELNRIKAFLTPFSWTEEMAERPAVPPASQPAAADPPPGTDPSGGGAGTAGGGKKTLLGGTHHRSDVPGRIPGAHLAGEHRWIHPHQPVGTAIGQGALRCL